MKVLHINTRQTAGAALCAMRINNALIKEGIESRMLFAEGKSMPEGIVGEIAERDTSLWYSHPWLLRLKYQLVRTPFWDITDKEKMEVVLREKNKHLEKKLYLHGPYSSYKNLSKHPLVEWADVIHLHWVANFIDYSTFFSEVKKPIVWTLHDKFPAVGIQHNCSSSYPLPESLKEIDNFSRKIKRDGVLKAKSLNVVAISKQMVDICQHSDVLGGFPITLIHNGVDTEWCRPSNKQEARKQLGLPNDSKILLFSANSLDDENKGLDRLINALESLRVPNMILVCLGSNNPEKAIRETSFPIVCAGYVNEQNKLSKYYSAADLFMQCSLEETFAQAPLEAMACGLPVVSTPCSGAPELIQPFNGILCDGFDSDAIASGICQALTIDYDSTVIRQYVVDNFEYDIIAKQYIELYQSLMTK